MTFTSMELNPLLKVSELAENLIGSEIIKLAGEVKQKIELGEKIFNYTIGDFDPSLFPIPAELEEAIIEAYKQGETNYPTPNGLPGLRESISRFLHTRCRLEYHKDHILVAAGARPLIYGAYQALVDPGDAVVFPVPSWNNNHYTHLTRGTPVPIETKPENNFMPAASDIKPFIQKASLISLCSPLNPTGTVLPRVPLMDICSMILEENRKRGEMNKPVYLLFDQVYWTLTYGQTVHCDPVSLVPEMKNYTVYTDGISKGFAATGVRVGWAMGPKKIINKMAAILTHLGAWAPRAEQVACAKFLLNDKAVNDYQEKFRQEIAQRLRDFYEGFYALKEEGFRVDAIEPQAAIYLTVKLNFIGKHTQEGQRLRDANDIADYLLHEAGIALVPFSAFGASRHSPWFRLSVGTAKPGEAKGFFSSLKQAIEKLV